MSADGFEALAAVERCGRVESIHRGAIVGLNADGTVCFALGDPEIEVFARSAWKPAQAVGMVKAGLDLPDDLLAVVCSSHSGTQDQLQRVKAILALGQMNEGSLANPAEYPFDPMLMRDCVRRGDKPARLFMNCSGKHAGMLLTCAVNEWPTDSSYIDPDHPLQRALARSVERLTSGGMVDIATDGCGAPTYVSSLHGIAQTFRGIALGKQGSAERVVYRAMTSYPVLAAGPGRIATTFMSVAPGLLVKDGAEGVFAAALPDGRALAFKVADGGNRASRIVLFVGLSALGVDVSAAVDYARVPIYGGEHEVGSVRATSRMTAIGSVD